MKLVNVYPHTESVSEVADISAAREAAIGLAADEEVLEVSTYVVDEGSVLKFDDVTTDFLDCPVDEVQSVLEAVTEAA